MFLNIRNDLKYFRNIYIYIYTYIMSHNGMASIKLNIVTLKLNNVLQLALIFLNSTLE